MVASPDDREFKGAIIDLTTSFFRGRERERGRRQLDGGLIRLAQASRACKERE